MPSRTRTSILLPATAVAMMAALLAGCTGGSKPAQAPTRNSYFENTKTINLQSGDFPSFLAFGAHDTLWFTENGGNLIARINAAGDMVEIPIQAGTNNDPQDIINVPDGSIWFTGLAEIGRIGPDGAMKVWYETLTGSAVGLPDALAAGPDDEVLVHQRRRLYLQDKIHR